jgi:uncharacterized protein (DUF58 family)
MRAIGVAVLGALMCVAGGAFDLPSLYVPGVAFVVIAVCSAVWVLLAARGARVVRVAGPATVEEEDPYPLVLRVEPGVLPPPGGELLEPLLGRPLPAADPRSRRVRVNVRFSRRGRRELEPARLVIRDPMSLLVRETRTDPATVLVLPRIEPVLVVGERGGTSFAARGAGIGQAAELELDHLRPYRPGTPASRIHWPTVARTGEMLERRLVAAGDSRPLVVLDARRPSSEEALDRAVRAAASLAVHLARDTGGAAVLLPGDRRAHELDADLHSFPPLHARLALVRPVDNVPPSGQLEREGAVFWVMAHGGRKPAALSRLPSRAFLVAPDPVGNLRASFTVAGCTGYALSQGARRAAA